MSRPREGTGRACGSHAAMLSTPVKASNPFSPRSFIIDTTAMWLSLSPPASSSSSRTATTPASSRSSRSARATAITSVPDESIRRTVGEAEPSSPANWGDASERPRPSEPSSTTRSAYGSTIGR